MASFMTTVKGAVSSVGETVAKPFVAAADAAKGYWDLDWNAPEVVEWKQKSGKEQQQLYVALGDRQFDVYEEGPSQSTLLATKVAYALHGPPTSADDDIKNLLDGYTEEQQESAKKIANLILEVSGEGDVHMGVIFVYGKMGKGQQFAVPVFAVKRAKNKIGYVDTFERIYKSWDDYLQKNRLPRCKYCYPTVGFYSHSCEKYEYDPNVEVCITYGVSKASRFASRLGSATDKFSGILGIASAGICVASLFTPLAPVVVGATTIVGISSSIYGAARSGYHLHDRVDHGQTINPLANMEVFGDWLSVIGSAVGNVTFGVTTVASAAAQAGAVASASERFLITALSVSSLSIKTVGIVFGLAGLIEKAENGVLTPLDVAMFSASLFFFTHTLISPMTARQIISKAQDESVLHHAQGITEHEKTIFSQVIEGFREASHLHEERDVSRTIRLINDPNEFFHPEGTLSPKGEL